MPDEKIYEKPNQDDIPDEARFVHQVEDQSMESTLWSRIKTILAGLFASVDEVAEMSNDTPEAPGDGLNVIWQEVEIAGVRYMSAYVPINSLASVLGHDSLLGYVANRHIDHSAVNINVGANLTGGGPITGNVSIGLSPSSRSFGVGSGGVKPGDTDGAEPISIATSEGLFYDALDFGTADGGEASLQIPISNDFTFTTIKVRFVWRDNGTPGTASDTVVWSASARVFGHNESSDQAITGSEETVSSDFIASEYFHISDETDEITPLGGNPAGKLLYVGIHRRYGNVADDYAQGAALVGVIINFQ